MALAVVASAVKKYKQITISFSVYSLMRMFLVAILFSSEVVASQCSKNEFIVDYADGSTSCEICESCPPGQGLSHRCGTHIPSNARVFCVPCQPGDTFSNGEDTSSCTPCSSCAENQVVLQKCTLTNDAKCEERCYSKDRYFDGSGSCLPCSECCGDGEDKFEEECKQKSGATSDNVCSFNQSINRCDVTATATTTSTRAITNLTSTSNATASVTGLPTTLTFGGLGTSGPHSSERKGGSEAGLVALYVVLHFLVIVSLAALVFIYVLCTRRIVEHSMVFSRDDSDVEKGNRSSERAAERTTAVEEQKGGEVVRASSEPLLGKRCSYSRGNGDMETGSQKSFVAKMSSIEMAIEERLVSARKWDEVNDNEEEQEGSTEPLLGKDPAKLSCICQEQRKVEKDSKPLESLLNCERFLDKICERLDTPISGRCAYKVIAQHFGYDHYKITSVFEKHPGGPSRAIIEKVVTRHPELTVEGFASLVEGLADRNDVAQRLREYDSLTEVGDEIV